MAVRWLPVRVREWLRLQQRRRRLQWPRTGTVGFGPLHGVRPASRVFGLDRGLPIDRYYMERFLAAHRGDIAGRVLEIGDDRYTRKFGGSLVLRSDVLHCVGGTRGATLIADLTAAQSLPVAVFDCVIATQTLQMIYDVRAACENLARMLKPGGVLLVTSHGISRVARREGIDPWGEYWHFTSQSLRRLLTHAFDGGAVDVTAYGNVLSAIASLHGLAAEELTAEELDYADPDYEVLLGARAVKT
jgi:SAM-dependent methyltransferase